MGNMPAVPLKATPHVFTALVQLARLLVISTRYSLPLSLSRFHLLGLVASKPIHFIWRVAGQLSFAQCDHSTLHSGFSSSAVDLSRGPLQVAHTQSHLHIT